MAGTPSEFRSTLSRARALGKTLLHIYSSEDAIPAELLALLDIAEARLQHAGYDIQKVAPFEQGGAADETVEP